MRHLLIEKMRFGFKDTQHFLTETSGVLQENDGGFKQKEQMNKIWKFDTQFSSDNQLIEKMETEYRVLIGNWWWNVRFFSISKLYLIDNREKLTNKN